MKKKDIKQIINLVGLIVVCGFGYCMWGMGFVPNSKYETIKMQPNQNEAFYVNNWCTPDFGRTEFVLWDKSRCDCLTKDYAIEFDFAHKWAESVGQSLYYAKLTKRKPAVTIILTKPTDIIYLKRLEALTEQTGIKIFAIRAF